MMSASIKLNDRHENENDTSQTHNSESAINNNKEISNASKKPRITNQSNGRDIGAIQEIIIHTLSGSLGVEPSSLDINENFANMGVDSLLTIEIRGELQKAFQDIDLSPTVLFDHPCITALTTFIVALKPKIIDQKNEDDEEIEQENPFASTVEADDTSLLSIHDETPNDNKLNEFHPDSDISPNLIRNRLIGLIATSMKISGNMICDDDDLLADIGIDPMLAIEITVKLQESFNLHLSSSVIFDYPTLRQLTEFIQKELLSQIGVGDTIEEHKSTLVNTNDSEKREDSSDENRISTVQSATSSIIIANQSENQRSCTSLFSSSSLPDVLPSSVTSSTTNNSLESQNSPMLSTLSSSDNTSKSLPKISTIKTIYSKIKLPQIISEPDLLYEPFPMVNLCQAYTLGQFLPEMAVRSHVLLIKSFKLDLDVDKLEVAWNQSIQRHPMLRCEINSEFCFQILKEVPYYVIKRFYTSSESEQQAQVEQLKRWRLNIDVNMKWPMIDLFVVHGPEKIILVFDADIVVVDFQSLLTVSEELLCMYKDQSDKLKNKISISYRDYIMHYRTLVQNFPLAQEQKKYWMDRVSTIPGGIRFPQRPDRVVSGLPTRNPGFDTRYHRLESSLWQKIQASIRQRGLQVPTTVCALFASVLSVFCNCNHFTLNIVFVNRLLLHPEVERLVGNLSSALLLEFDYRDPNLTFYQHARNVYQRFLADLMNSSFFTASHLVPILNNRRHSTLIPVSKVAFVSLLQFDEHFQSLNDDDFSFYFERNAPNNEYAVLETAAMELDHQIAINADGSLSMSFDFVQDLLPKNLMEHFIECYIEKLVSLVKDETWESKAMLHLYNIHDIHAQPLLGSNSIVLKPLVTLPNNGVNDSHFQSPLLFSEFVRLATDPDSAYRTALISTGRDLKLSYQKVCYLALKLAAQLKKLMPVSKSQSKSPNHIGVSCQRGWEQVISCLAITMIGGVFVPIDGDLPLEQYEMRLKLTNVETVCTTKVILEQLRRKSLDGLYKDIQFIEVDVVLASNFQQVLQNSLVHCEEYLHEICASHDPKHAAYIIFTSSTTGFSKPVYISHASVMNTIIDINSRIKLNKKDRVIGLSNLSFDLSIWDLFGSFHGGSTLVLLDEGNDTASDPFCWLKVIDKYQITVWNSVPQLLYLLYHTIDQTQVEQRLTIRSMRQILLSGDWIPLELPFKFYSLWMSVQENQYDRAPLQILSLGGATECSIWSNFHWIDCTSSSTDVSYTYAGWLSIPYGQPLSGQSLHILGSALDFCPDNVTGQLFIGGAGLADCYYGNPDLTNRHFIIHPVTNERLYATGDSARFRSFGSDRVVELLGRIEGDSQVKIQGYRVECSEIEWSLSRLEFIKQAVVIVRKSSNTKKQSNFKFESSSMLVACIVLDVSCAATDKLKTVKLSILRHCQNSLPHYMVPHSILFVKEIPRSFNGKVDKEAILKLHLLETSSILSECKDTIADIENGYDIDANHLANGEMVSDNISQDHGIICDPSQSSSTVTKLWSIWNRALNYSDELVPLGTAPVNVNLIALGATSLTFLMMHALIQQEFGITLPLKFFMEEPRLYQMNERIQHEMNRRETNVNTNRIDNYPTRLTIIRKAHVVCLNRAEAPTAGPLIFFHPSTGSVQCYNQMSQLMIEKTGARHSYAIQAFGLEDNESVEVDFIQIVQAYFDAIKTIAEATKSSSFSTLTLIGYSSGGILANAVGQEFILCHQGNLIESIILLDTPGPTTTHYLSPVTDDIASTTVIKSLNTTKDDTISIPTLSFKTNAFSKIVAVTKANLVAIQTYFSAMSSSSLNLEQLDSLINKIILVRAAERHVEADHCDPSWGWEEYFHHVAKLITKSIHTDSVESAHTKDIGDDIMVRPLMKPIWSPGTHFQLLSPINIGNLVEQLDDRLRQKFSDN